jgi:hypothetical protein
VVASKHLKFTGRDFVVGALGVQELGFDGAIDYKSEDVKHALAQHCPKGIDIYFDNVGGDILDKLARGARIVICGAISRYNNTTGVKGPANYLSPERHPARPASHLRIRASYLRHTPHRRSGSE